VRNINEKFKDMIIRLREENIQKRIGLNVGHNYDCGFRIARSLPFRWPQSPNKKNNHNFLNQIIIDNKKWAKA
jgi:hypothetical protein